jgi:hypothetical protein
MNGSLNPIGIGDSAPDAQDELRRFLRLYADEWPCALRENCANYLLLLQTYKESDMEFIQIAANVADFFKNHLLISIAALLVVVFFFYQSPKESFKFLVLVAILLIAGYFILQLGSSTETGVSVKKEMINKSKKALGE